MSENIYTQGAYLDHNPTWHIEDSPWKARHIIEILRRNKIRPRTVVEIGSGAGEILRQLQLSLDAEAQLVGYEVSPQAIALSQARANQALRFVQGDFLSASTEYFDLVLMIDLIEHLEDYLGFLRAVRPRGEYKLLHIPLDLSVQTVLRMEPILRVRRQVGHLHYFTKELALQALCDSGYTIIDHCYTASMNDLGPRTLRHRLASLPRRLLYSVHRDLAVRLLGGYSLLVLAR